MKFDFTTIMDRRGKDATAVDAFESRYGVTLKEGFDLLPMWVADMNYPTCPSILKALQDRISHPAFGYFAPRDEYFDAIINWHKTRKGAPDITRDCIGYENGVLGGAATAAMVLGNRGGKILVHSPTYVGFTGTLLPAGFDLVYSSLVQDEQGVWRMDFADMEKKLKEQAIHTAILCSPHNPCGRVWERWELEQAMELFRKYDVYVISDEIWSDIILNGHTHIPTQEVSEDAKMRTVALYAPTKTFSLAGLVGSYHVIYNPRLRDLIRKESSLSHYNTLNVLSMHALIGAYSETGAEWVDELRQVLSGNINFACVFLAEHCPEISVFKPEGTYMMYLDCTKWCEKHGKTLDELLNAGAEVGVLWQDGRGFHGPCHIRMNLALPRARVEEAFRRLKEYVL